MISVFVFFHALSQNLDGKLREGNYVICVIKTNCNGRSFGDDIYLPDKFGQLFADAMI